MCEFVEMEQSRGKTKEDNRSRSASVVPGAPRGRLVSTSPCRVAFQNTTHICPARAAFLSFLTIPAGMKTLSSRPGLDAISRLQLASLLGGAGSFSGSTLAHAAKSRSPPLLPVAWLLLMSSRDQLLALSACVSLLLGRSPSLSLFSLLCLSFISPLGPTFLGPSSLPSRSLVGGLVCGTTAPPCVRWSPSQFNPQGTRNTVKVACLRRTSRRFKLCDETLSVQE